MTSHKDQAMIEKLVQKIEPHSLLHHIRPLKGGVSAEVTAELVQPNGLPKTVVVRQHGEADRRRNPEIADDEFRLLNSLHSVGLPVPKPLFLDTSCEIFAHPVVVLEYLDGSSEFSLAKRPKILDESVCEEEIRPYLTCQIYVSNINIEKSKIRLTLYGNSKTPVHRH